MDMKSFEKDMQVFSFKQHQGFLSYLKRLNEKGWTIEDAQQWINAKKKRLDRDRRQTRRNRKAYESKMLRCPKCSTIMFIRPVNFDAKTQTGDPKDKSVWICPNEKCMHTIYDERHMNKILELR